MQQDLQKTERVGEGSYVPPTLQLEDGNRRRRYSNIQLLYVLGWITVHVPALNSAVFWVSKYVNKFIHGTSKTKQNVTGAPQSQMNKKWSKITVSVFKLNHYISIISLMLIHCVTSHHSTFQFLWLNYFSRLPRQRATVQCARHLTPHPHQINLFIN